MCHLVVGSRSWSQFKEERQWEPIGELWMTQINANTLHKLAAQRAMNKAKTVNLRIDPAKKHFLREHLTDPVSSAMADGCLKGIWIWGTRYIERELLYRVDKVSYQGFSYFVMIGSAGNRPISDPTSSHWRIGYWDPRFRQDVYGRKWTPDQCTKSAFPNVQVPLKM